LHISITGYEKRGEGMQSFVVFKVVTKVYCRKFFFIRITVVGFYLQPVAGQSVGFTKKEYDVWRRFSDFLGLHDKLVEKHVPNGIIIPPAPEKNVLSRKNKKISCFLDFSLKPNVLGSTKTKITRNVEEDTTNDFLERRRAMLQRFLQRCCLHPTILLVRELLLYILR